MACAGSSCGYQKHTYVYDAVSRAQSIMGGSASAMYNQGGSWGLRFVSNADIMEQVRWVSSCHIFLPLVFLPPQSVTWYQPGAIRPLVTLGARIHVAAPSRSVKRHSVRTHYYTHMNQSVSGRVRATRYIILSNITAAQLLVPVIWHHHYYYKSECQTPFVPTPSVYLSDTRYLIEE